MSVRAWNTSHTSIHVAWGNIPTGFVHGVLLGYRVLFWRANESEEIYETKVVDRERRSVELDNLWIFTNYSIQVLGFTSVGDGAVSRTLIVSTGEFSKFFFHVQSQLQPLGPIAPLQLEVTCLVTT